MPRFPKVTCPDCKSHLISLRLGAFVEHPNNYRTMNYTCPNCIEKDGKPKIFFMKKQRLNLKRKTKFEEVNRLINKDFGRFRNLNGHTMLDKDNKIPTVYCMHCKMKLYYDSHDSFVNSKENEINIRTFYHFGCKKVPDSEPIFTFMRAEVNCMITVRIIEWVGVGTITNKT